MKSDRVKIVKRALRFWDPIGVIEDREDGADLGDDEYDSYAVGFLRSVENGNDAYKLARHLSGIRANSMRIGDKNPTEMEEEIAEKLVTWREQDFVGIPDFRFTRYAI